MTRYYIHHQTIIGFLPGVFGAEDACKLITGAQSRHTMHRSTEYPDQQSVTVDSKRSDKDQQTAK